MNEDKLRRLMGMRSLSDRRTPFPSAEEVKLRLRPRLVPKPLWGKNLRADLGVRWLDISNELRRMAGYKCELCKGGGEGAPGHRLHVDEVWEYEDEHHTAYLKDLIVTCWWCHAMIHAAHTGQEFPKHWPEVVDRALTVNGQPAELLHAVIQLELYAWNERSKYKDWSIDWDDWEVVYEEARSRLAKEEPPTIDF